MDTTDRDAQLTDAELIYVYLGRIVNHEDEVHVDERRAGNVVHYTIRVHPSDAGLVVGRHGSVVDALRTLIGCAAARDGYKVRIQVVPAAKSIAA